MPTILLKKSDTPGSVPGTANLTNLAGGAEVAVNTADKRMFSMTSASAVIELGTNPSSLTCADASFTLMKATSATITNLTATSIVISNLSIASANITTLTSASATITNLINTSASITTITNSPTFSAGTANGVLYLNGSKVATSGSALTFDGTTFGVTSTWGSNSQLFTNATASNLSGITARYNGANKGYLYFDNSTSLYNLYGEAGISLAFTANAAEGMRLNSTGLGIGTTSPAAKLSVVDSTRASAVIADSAGRTLRLQGPDASANPATVGTSTNHDFLLEAGSTAGGLNAMRFATGGTEKMRLDSSGNLGIGTASPANKLDVVGGISATKNQSSLNLISSSGQSGFATITNSGGVTYVGVEGTGGGASFSGASANASIIGSGTTNPLQFVTNTTVRATLDSSGNLGLGVTPVSQNGKVFHIDGGAGAADIRLTNNATGSAINNGGLLTLVGSDIYLWNLENNFLSFGTNNAERARITAGGYFKASNDGTYQGSTSAYHELRTSAADYSTIVGNTNASPYGAYILFGNADPNNTTNLFLLCNGWNGTANTTRATIRSNGGLANYQANDVNLSDQRVKKDIKPLGSMWDKFKALEIVTFKYKDQTHDDDNIGVIAQQVESVAPEFIDTDGFGETPEGEEPLKTVYTTDMYHAAIKALQEAMARIEQLEAKVAALEA